MLHIGQVVSWPLLAAQPFGAHRAAYFSLIRKQIAARTGSVDLTPNELLAGLTLLRYVPMLMSLDNAPDRLRQDATRTGHRRLSSESTAWTASESVKRPTRPLQRLADGPLLAGNEPAAKAPEKPLRLETSLHVGIQASTTAGDFHVSRRSGHSARWQGSQRSLALAAGRSGTGGSEAARLPAPVQWRFGR